MDNVTALKALSISLVGSASPSNIVADQIEYIAAHIKTRKADAQANSESSNVAGIVADFNSLLAKLREAGIISGA